MVIKPEISDGVLDLTGSYISSDKNVAVVSGKVHYFIIYKFIYKFVSLMSTKRINTRLMCHY